MKKVKAKPRQKPWSDAVLDYDDKNNWQKIAKEMLLEQPALPSTWGLDDLETRVWMEEKFGFDCALFPKLWLYLYERLPILVLRLEASTAPPGDEVRP